jgi:hypothetical protein
MSIGNLLSINLAPMFSEKHDPKSIPFVVCPMEKPGGEIVMGVLKSITHYFYTNVAIKAVRVDILSYIFCEIKRRETGGI